MKVTRSYWLGLGSGFILSAILMGFISLYQGQAAMLAKPSVNSTVKQNKNSKLPQKTQSESSNPTQNSAQNFSAKSTSNSLNSATSDQNFVVPKGASAEQIADLLMAQGLIKDKVKNMKETAGKILWEKEYIMF